VQHDASQASRYFTRQDISRKILRTRFGGKQDINLEVKEDSTVRLYSIEEGWGLHQRHLEGQTP